MIQVFVWLVVLAVAVALVSLLSIQVFLGRNSQRLVLLAGGILAVGFCLLAGDSLQAAGRLRLDNGFDLLLRAGIILFAAVAVALQFGALRWILAARSLPWTRISMAGLIACQVVVAGWAGWRFQQSLSASNTLPMLGSVDIEVIPGEALLTTKGRLVPVYRSRIAPNLERYVETAGDDFANRRIQCAAQDAQSNCHGWVFTGGQYLLTGRCVEMILADNDYQIVDQPQPGDVIVYRDAFDKILHTGLVRLALDDGVVLIESKWGIDERYLHLPQDQHYSQRFKFYRRQSPSDRSDHDSSHFVQAVKILPGNLVVSMRPEEALVAHPQSVDSLLKGWPLELLPASENYPMGAE